MPAMNSGTGGEARLLAAARKKSIVALAVVVFDVLILVLAAASRVGRVDPEAARFAITPGIIFLTVAALVIGIAWIALVFRLVVSPVEDAASVASLALVPLAILAINLAPLHLALPLVNDAGGVVVPLLAPPAGRYVLALNVLLALELALSIARLYRFRPKLWWQGRMATYLVWGALLVVMILGPNLLRGDALEWSAGFASSSPPRPTQRWLQQAPRAIEGWWPGLQVLLGVGLLAVLIRIARDLPMFVRSFRKG